MFVMLGVALVIIGVLLLFAGFIMQIVLAFKDSILWGVLSIFFCGLGNLIWVAVNYKEGWRPLVVFLGGIPPMVFGYIIIVMEAARAIVENS